MVIPRFLFLAGGFQLFPPEHKYTRCCSSGYKREYNHSSYQIFCAELRRFRFCFCFCYHLCGRFGGVVCCCRWQSPAAQPEDTSTNHANIRCFIVIPPLLFSSPCKDSIKNTAPDKTSSAVSCFRLRLITSLHSGWYMVQYDVPDIPNEFHSSESEHCYKHPYLFRQESAYQ